MRLTYNIRKPCTSVTSNELGVEIHHHQTAFQRLKKVTNTRYCSKHVQPRPLLVPSVDALCSRCCLFTMSVVLPLPAALSAAAVKRYRAWVGSRPSLLWPQLRRQPHYTTASVAPCCVLLRVIKWAIFSGACLTGRLHHRGERGPSRRALLCSLSSSVTAPPAQTPVNNHQLIYWVIY